MLLPLSLLIFFVAYYEESYQRLCENPRTLCLTGNLYVLYLPFFKELWQTEKEHSSLDKFWYFSPSCYAVFNYNLHFTEILKKSPRL